MVSVKHFPLIVWVMVIFAALFCCAAPVYAFANEYGGTSAGEPYVNADADGDGYGDNVSFSVPTELNFVVKADGTLIGPSDARVVSHDDEFGMRVSSIKASPLGSWSLVPSIEGNTTSNVVSLDMSAGSDSVRLSDYVDKSELPVTDAWHMGAAGAVSLAFAGKVARVVDDITSLTPFCAVDWYVTSDKPSPYGGQAYAVLSSDGTLTFFRSTETYSGTAEQTVHDVFGNEYTGRVYAGVESTGTTKTSAPWYGERASIRNVRVAPGQVIEPTSCAGWFCECVNLTNCDAIGGLLTNKATTLNNMFYGCTSLISLDLSHFETDSVENMGCMFQNCSSISSLDVSHFNTSKVTTMNVMFNNCSSLTSLDVTTWDTSKVRSMHSMFSGCSGLTVLDVSHFDTRAVTDMGSMFQNCSNVEVLDLDVFDTSACTTMNCMFMNCSNLSDLNISGFETPALTDMGFMFQNCSKLEDIDVSGFDTSHVTKFSGVFNRCTALVALDLSGFDTFAATTMNNMFGNCPTLKSVKLGEKFSFAGANITTTADRAVLPTPPTTTPYNGRWINKDVSGAAPVLAANLRDYYDGSLALGDYTKGTYVWNGLAPVTVTYHSNYGVSGKTDATIEKQMWPGDVLEACSFTHPEKRMFDEWNTEADGTGHAYHAGWSLADVSNVDLYAQWHKTLMLHPNLTLVSFSTTPEEFALVNIEVNEGGTVETVEGDVDLEFVEKTVNIPITVTNRIASSTSPGNYFDFTSTLAANDFKPLIGDRYEITGGVPWSGVLHFVYGNSKEYTGTINVVDGKGVLDLRTLSERDGATGTYLYILDFPKDCLYNVSFGDEHRVVTDMRDGDVPEALLYTVADNQDGSGSGRFVAQIDDGHGLFDGDVDAAVPYAVTMNMFPTGAVMDSNMLSCNAIDLSGNQSQNWQLNMADASATASFTVSTKVATTGWSAWSGWMTLGHSAVGSVAKSAAVNHFSNYQVRILFFDGELRDIIVEGGNGDGEAIEGTSTGVSVTIYSGSGSESDTPDPSDPEKPGGPTPSPASPGRNGLSAATPVLGVLSFVGSLFGIS